MSSFQGVGIVPLYTEVSSFQGVGIEEFHYIHTELCLHFRGLKGSTDTYIITFFQVFLKYYHLEHLIKVLSGYERSATVLQSVMRGWMARKKVKKMKEERQERAAVVIQAGTFIDTEWKITQENI